MVSGKGLWDKDWVTLWANLETGDSWADLSLSAVLRALSSPKAASILLKLPRLGLRAVPLTGGVFCEEATSNFEVP